MKTAVFATILLCLAKVVNAQSPQNDWERMKLNGKPRVMKEYNYQQLEDSGQVRKGKLNTITEFSFNPDGFITSEVATGPQGQQIYRIVYTYNTTNFLAGKDVFYGQGPSTVQKRYKYYPDGKVMDEEQWLRQNPQTLTHYTYNKKGELTEKSTLYPYEPDQSFKVTYKYDANGNMIEKNTDQVGVIYTREFFRYDDKGIILEKQFAKKKGDPHVTLALKYEWDQNMNWVTMTESASKKDWSEKYVRERVFEYY